MKSGYGCIAKFSPAMIQKQVVVIILDIKVQSQPCLSIYCTNDETLEGSSCCQLLELVQTHLILVQKVGVWNQNCHHPWLKSQGVVMVIHHKIKSLLYLTMYNTYNEILEGCSCCEMLESVQTHLFLMWTVGMGV